MNFRGTLGGLGLMLMAWPALGQGLQQPFAVAPPDARFARPSGVMAASYSALATDDPPPPPPGGTAVPAAPAAPAAPASPSTPGIGSRSDFVGWRLHERLRQRGRIVRMQ